MRLVVLTLALTYRTGSAVRSAAGPWLFAAVSTTPAPCVAWAKPAANTSFPGALRYRPPGRSARALSGPWKQPCRSPLVRT
eukprot:10356839-Lingulodinium_polyedra.AAC.1